MGQEDIAIILDLLNSNALLLEAMLDLSRAGAF